MKSDTYVDLSISSAGNTTSGTTKANIVFNDNSEVQKLKATINQLKTAMNGREDYIKNLEFQLRLAKASKKEIGQDMSIFTEEELKFILSKVHPDKNPNSNLAPDITKKLIQNRKG